MKRIAVPTSTLVLLLAIIHICSADKCYFKSRFIFHTASLDCQDGFCCGTCENRYCCSDPSLSLNQTACASCSAYTDEFGLDWPGSSCDPSLNLFCCGTCDNRYCCKRLTRVLDQTQCSNNFSPESSQVTVMTTTSASQQTSTERQQQKQSTSQGESTTSETTNTNYYSLFYNPSLLWLKILIIVIPFVIVIMLIVSIVTWSKYQVRRRKERARKFPARSVVSTLSSSSHEQAPVPILRSISAIVHSTTPANTGNIQDIHTMYNDDLSLVVPNYETVQHQGSELRTVEGPFIYPLSDDLPKYDNLTK